LPTADEWQRVASNGGSAKYPWGAAEPDGSLASELRRSRPLRQDVASLLVLVGAQPGRGVRPGGQCM
jgi:formylglycine-generating enzyme required for sulfatase activity